MDRVCVYGGYAPVFGRNNCCSALNARVQAFWNHTCGHLSYGCARGVNAISTAIGVRVRDSFFFILDALKAKASSCEMLEEEHRFSSDYWTSAYCDPNLPGQAEVRNYFSARDQRVSIDLGNGRTVTACFRVIESRGIEKEGGHVYTHVRVPGIAATIYNEIAPIHDAMAAFLNNTHRGSQARFIIVSENNFSMHEGDPKPVTAEEAGLALWRVLEHLGEQYGSIDQLDAHSLGVAFVASALKQGLTGIEQRPAALPWSMWLGCGPVSIWETSKNQFQGLGRAIYPFAKAGGWAIDVEGDLLSVWEQISAHSSLLVTGVKRDHYFFGEANLCTGRLAKQPGVHSILFDIPLQMLHERAHHNARPSVFHNGYIVSEVMSEGEGKCMQKGQTLISAIIDRSYDAMIYERNWKEPEKVHAIA